MNSTQSLTAKRFGLGLLIVSLFAHRTVSADESSSRTHTNRKHIGIYDSRALAYAYFWSEPQQNKRNQQAATAKPAKAAGDTETFKKLSAALAEQQQKIHQQVFSIAPADEALSAISRRLPEIQTQVGVSALVSKWDKPALKAYQAAMQLDVTDTLVREFKLSEKHLKTIEEIKKAKPVPLDKIDKHDRR
jgi:hypothetical protein